MIVQIDLFRSTSSWPISANHRLDGSGYLRKVARLWRNHVRDYTAIAWSLLLPEKREALRAASAWSVTLTWCWGRYKQPGDLDNYRKLTLDGIQQATGVDDSRYRGTDKVVEGKEPRLTITIEPLEEK